MSKRSFWNSSYTVACKTLSPSFAVGVNSHFYSHQEQEDKPRAQGSIQIFQQEEEADSAIHHKPVPKDQDQLQR